MLSYTHPISVSSVLRLEPNDADAMQTKLFLLLQTEQYETALAIIGSGHDFEKTYSLYRLQRETEAQAGLDILKALHNGQDDQEARGVLHLEAQLVCFVYFYGLPYHAADYRTIKSYRKGSYQIACDLYNQLLDTVDNVSDFFFAYIKRV